MYLPVWLMVGQQRSDCQHILWGLATAHAAGMLEDRSSPLGIHTMNERQWLSSTDLNRMLGHVVLKGSERKLRLLACALTRLHWAKLSAKARRAVEAAEQFADDPAGGAAMRAAAKAMVGSTAEQRARARSRSAEVREAEAAARRCTQPNARLTLKQMSWMNEDYSRPRRELVREVFGNPFRPITPDPTWLAWDDGVLVKLASVIYRTRAWDRMPILADALEDAGCTDEAILSHCRSGGVHARGCWVLDLLTGEKPLDVPDEPATSPRAVARKAAADAELEEARQEHAGKPCPGCQDAAARRVLRVQKAGPNHGRLFVRCFKCDRFDWLDEPAEPERDEEREALQASAGPCPTCGKSRRAQRVRKEGPNQGRLFLACTDRACDHFEWAGATGTEPAAADRELERLRRLGSCCMNCERRVTFGRVRKAGRNQGRLYSRCAHCGAFCWW